MPSKKRILALDLLRGYYLFAIVIDHMARFPSPFQLITGGGELWVSAAEGFFIISGTLVGYLSQAKSKIFKRALKLYVVSVSFTFLFTYWGQYIPEYALKWGIWTHHISSDFFIKVFTLQYEYGWADFLAYYVIFLLFAPAALYIVKKKYGSIILILLSFLVWTFRGEDHYLSWQIYFMVGIVFGHNLTFFESKFLSLKKGIQKNIQNIMLGISSVFILISAFFIFVFNNKLENYFDKDEAQFPRIVLSIFWFLTLYIFFRRHEEIINKITRGFLNMFGRNSLLTYSVHAVILFPINSFLPEKTNFIQNTLIYIFVLVAIYFILLFWEKLRKREINNKS